MTFVDGLEVGDIQDVTLRDRKKLARDGTFIVVAPIAERDGSMVGTPDITARGFVYMGNRRQLMKEVSNLVKDILRDSARQGIADPGSCRSISTAGWQNTSTRRPRNGP